MKITITILLSIFLTFETYAQINESDARLQYQKVVDAYETGDFYNASVISEDLKRKMGKWTPKVLYMFLQSSYRLFTTPGQNTHGQFTKSLQTFTYIKAVSDTAFLLIDKASYPQEKYQDLVKTQQFFKDMVQKYGYQTSRTPEKAIAFLNETAAKFPNIQKTALGDDGKYFGENDMILGKPYINFKIDSPYLHIIMITKILYTTSNKYNSVYIWNDFFHLYRSPYLDEEKAVKDDRVYGCRDHKKRFDRQFDVDRKDTTYANNKLYKISAYPILLLFDAYSKEFIAGEYEDRIRDAFTYLMECFPKTIVSENKKEDRKEIGF